MANRHGTLTASDSMLLSYRYWLPDEPPEAVVAYLHGVGGHSGQPTYRYLIESLVSSRRAVYGLDLRGFGRSEGRRGHVDDWRNYLSDVSAFLATVRREYPQVPMFLFGQSLGGLIALEYAIEADRLLSGVIVSAPAVAQRDAPVWLHAMVHGLSKVTPTVSVNPHVDPAAFTRDPAEVVKLVADPLRYPKVTVRFAVEYEAAVDRVLSEAPLLNVPLLIVVGSADTVTPPRASQSFCDRVIIEDKTLKMYDGGFHQPILDIERDEVLSDIGRWITDHIAARGDFAP